MFFFFHLLTIALCKPEENITFNYFNEAEYAKFRDALSRNHFLLTFFISPSPNYDLHKDYIFDICNIISESLPNVSISYAIVNYTNSEIKNPFVRIYLPGMSEVELQISINSIVRSNVCAIIKECRGLAITLRRLNKLHKSPEIARIKEELREIANSIKKQKHDQEKLKKLNEDYEKLADEYLQFIPENKQKKKLLKLKLNVLHENSKEAEQIRTELEQLKKIKKENKSTRLSGLSPDQIERKQENAMIKQLKRVAVRCQNQMYYDYIIHFLGSIKNFFVNAYHRSRTPKQTEL